jgi:predicted nucleic acid-binding protein
MSGYLLDANVISELTKAPPAPQVVTFLTQQYDLWLSVIVIHELEFGVQGMPDGQRRDGVSAVYRTVIDQHADRILPVERPVAERAAQLRVQARRAGRDLHLADALIAGTAIVHDLILATRNVKDVADLDVDVVNPWEFR